MAKKARKRDEARASVHNTRRFKMKVFDEWPLKNGARMRVSIDHHEGHDLVHVRRWQRGPYGQLYATEMGAAIRIGQLRRLSKALKSIRAYARKIGVLPTPSRSK
jgi:hypothetical protein